MACVAPLSALAIDSSGFAGTIQATGQTAQVAIGDTISMAASTESGYQFKITVETEGDYHVDYAITNTDDDTGAATINKHSGILTPSEAGTVTVTAYLLDCDKAQTQDTPCDWDNVIATATKTVTITENTAGDYGFQGNNLQIKMTSFDPQVVSSSSTAYVNSLSNVTAVDGYYSFDITQNFGTGSDFAAFVTSNDSAINLYRGQNSTPVCSLGDGTLNLVGTSQSNNVTVQIPDILTAGNYTLTFDSNYQSANGRTLGATVSFTFTIS